MKSSPSPACLTLWLLVACCVMWTINAQTGDTPTVTGMKIHLGKQFNKRGKIEILYYVIGKYVGLFSMRFGGAKYANKLYNTFLLTRWCERYNRCDLFHTKWKSVKSLKKENSINFCSHFSSAKKLTF